MAGNSNAIRRKKQGEENRRGDSGIVTVFAFLFIIVVFLVTLADSFELQGIGGHDFEISSAFCTRYDLTLVDFFFINIEITFALWTKDHNCLRSYQAPLIIFRFSLTGGQAPGDRMLDSSANPESMVLVLVSHTKPRSA
jgi:hypothetical protein